MSSKQFINKSMKNWDSSDPHDWSEKMKVSTVLKEVFHYYCVYDRTLFVDKYNFTFSDKHPQILTKEEIQQKYWIFKPDIWIKSHNTIIEIDGLFHFNTAKGIKQTNHRNEIYEYMGVKFVWFTTEFVKTAEMNDIYQQLKARL